MRGLLCGILLFLLLSTLSAAQSSESLSDNDWLMYSRFLNHSGASDASGPKTNTLTWAYYVSGSPRSNVVVSNGIAYSATDLNSSTGRIFAIHILNGTRAWNFTPAERVRGLSLAAGVLYVSSLNMTYALNASTGAQVWNYSGTYWLPSAVSDGVLYTSSGDTNDIGNSLIALNASTGSQICNYTLSNALISLSTKPAVADGRVFFGTANASVENYTLHVINATDCSYLWNATNTTASAYVTVPIVAYGVVYYGSGREYLFARNASTGEYIWNYTRVGGGLYAGVIYGGPGINDSILIAVDGPYLRFLNASNGSVIPILPPNNFINTGGIIRSSVVYADGIIYAPPDSDIKAYNTSTGSLVWSRSLGDYIYSAPALAGAMLFVGSNNGNVYAFGPPGCDSCSSCASNLSVNVSPTVINRVIASGDCINVNASNVILYCNGETLMGNGSGYGIYAGNKTNITLNKCVLSNFSQALVLNRSNASVSLLAIYNSSVPVVLNSSNNSVFNGLTIVNSSGGLVVDSSFNNSFRSVQITSPDNNFLSFVGYSLNNTFYNLTLLNNGSITYLQVELNQSATNQSVFISSQVASVNSSLAPQYNTSANVSLIWPYCPATILFNTGFSTSVSDFKSSPLCSAPRCTSVSCGGGRVNFSVSSFSGYAVYSCFNITSPGEYDLALSVSSNGTCMRINASDVLLDCNGSAISGNGSGAGVYVFNASNVTVKNCIISNFSEAISFNFTNSSYLLNNTAYDVSTGFLFLNASNNNGSYNNATNSSYGVSFSCANNTLFSEFYVENISGYQALSDCEAELYNYVINSTAFDYFSFYTEPSCWTSILYGWWMMANVTNLTGSADGVLVNATDQYGTWYLTSYSTSNASGLTPWMPVTEYSLWCSSPGYVPPIYFYATQGVSNGSAYVDPIYADALVNITLLPCIDSDGDGAGVAGNNSGCRYPNADDCDDSNASIMPPSDDLYINNDTTLCSGTYYLNDSAGDGLILLNTYNKSLDCNGSALAGNSSGYGIAVSANNATVKNCRVSNFSIGFYSAYNSYSRFFNNSAEYGITGFQFNNSLFSRLLNNSVRDSTTGFYFSGSSLYNNASQFRIANASIGINFTGSNGNLFSELEMADVNVSHVYSQGGSVQNNYIVNSSSVNYSNFSFSAGQTLLFVRWGYWATANVTNATGPASGAVVNATDALGYMESFSATTNSSGLTTYLLPVTAWLVNSTNVSNVSSHSFVARQGIHQGTASLEVYPDALVNITIGDCQDNDGDGFGAAGNNSGCVNAVPDCDDTNSSVLPPFDGLLINSSTTLCSGTYYINDSGSTGVVEINAHNVRLSCNGTVLIGTGYVGIDFSTFLSNVTIDGCDLRNYSACVSLCPGGWIVNHNITVQNSFFRDCGQGAWNSIPVCGGGLRNPGYIQAPCTSELQLYNNTIRGTGNISAYSTIFWSIANSRIENNTFIDSAFDIANSPALSYNNLFKNNTLINTEVSPGSAAGADRFIENNLSNGSSVVFAYSVGHVIAGNYFENSSVSSSPSWSSNNSIIANNTFNNSYIALSGQPVSNTTLTNNTFFGAVSVSPFSAIVLASVADNNRITGNFFNTTSYSVYAYSGSQGNNISLNHFYARGVYDPSANNSYCIGGKGNFYNETITLSRIGNGTWGSDCGPSNLSIANNSRVPSNYTVNISWSNQSAIEGYNVTYDVLVNSVLNATTSESWFFWNSTPYAGQAVSIRLVPWINGSRINATNQEANYSVCTDADNDSFYAEGGSLCGVQDCNDENASVTPPFDGLNVTQDTTLCNDTYYLNDSAADGIVRVMASNVSLSCNSTLIIGNGSGIGFYASGRQNISIAGCSLANFSTSVSLSGVSYSRFYNNSVSNNARGFYLYVSGFNNSFYNNSVINNTEGLSVYDHDSFFYDNFVNASIAENIYNFHIVGDNNSFYNNTVFGGGRGFFNDAGDNNSYSNNTVFNSTIGFWVPSGSNNLFYNNTLYNIASQGFRVGSSNRYFNNVIINASYIGITFQGTNAQFYNNVLINASTAFGHDTVAGSSNNFTNNSVSYGTTGFSIAGNSNRFYNNTALNTSGSGFSIVGNSNTLSNNSAFNNSNGFYITGSSNSLYNNSAFRSTTGVNVAGINNNVFNNSAFNNTYGFSVSAGSRIYNNSAFNNTQYGFYVTAGNSSISNNTVFNNAVRGFHVSANNTSFSGNTVFNNSQDGFRVSGNNNSFSTNIIDNCTNGVYFLGGSNNTAWLNHFYCGGVNDAGGNNSYCVVGQGNFYNESIAWSRIGNGTIGRDCGPSNFTRVNNSLIPVNSTVNVSWSNQSAISGYNVTYDVFVNGTLNATTNDSWFWFNSAPFAGLVVNLSLVPWINGSRINATNRFVTLGVCTDSDGDGFYAEGGPLCGLQDCNDDNASVIPPYDGLNVTQDTTLCNGTYYLNDSAADGVVRVMASNVSLSCNSTLIIGNRTGYGFFSSNQRNITIGGCSASNYTYGFSASVNSSRIFNNSAYNSSFNSSLGTGFVIAGTNNSIYGNAVFDSSLQGFLVTASNSTLYNNSALRNPIGFYMPGSNNSISGSVAVNSTTGFYDAGVNNTFYNNSANSTWPSGAPDCFLASGTGGIFFNSSATGCWHGFRTVNGFNNTIHSSIAFGNRNGFSGDFIGTGGNNTFYNNTARDSGNWGFVVGCYDVFFNNTAFNNGEGGFGIDVACGGLNNVIFNNIAINNPSGFLIRGSNNLVFNNSAMNSTVYGFGNPFKGLIGGSNNSVHDNYAYNDSMGFWIVSGGSFYHNNTVSNNIIGIRIEHGDNTFYNNSVSNSTSYGFFIAMSVYGQINNNTISNNTVFNSSNGLYISGNSTQGSSNNSVSGNQFYGSTYGVYITQGSNNNSVSGNQLFSNTNTCVYVQNGSGNLISNNSASNCTYGFRLDPAGSNNSVANNSAFNNTQSGFMVSSANNSLSNNSAFNNTLDGVLISGANNSVYNNSATFNRNGFNVTGANNSIFDNIACNNALYGVHVSGSGNLVYNNTFCSNNICGARLTAGSNSLLNNSILENAVCGVNVSAGNNTVDCAGAPVIGNGAGEGFLVGNVSNITIKNCFISNFSSAINFSAVNSSLVLNNTIYMNGLYGVYSSSGWNDVFSGNNITNVSAGISGNGILITAGNGNNFTNNLITQAFLSGIYAQDSNSTLLFNNTIFNCAASWYLVYVTGGSSIVANNTIHGIGYTGITAGFSGIIANNTIYDVDGQGIAAHGVFNITQNHVFNVTGGYCAVCGTWANSTISENLVHDTNGDCIGYDSAWASENSTFANNTIFNCSGGGVVFYTDSNGNNLFNNTIYQSAYGILLLTRSDDNIIGLSNVYNNSYGIYLSNASRNFIANSSLSNNSYDFWLENRSANNTALNTTFNRSLPVVVTDAGSNLTIQWYIRANVTRGGAPLSGSRVNATDVLSGVRSLGTTSASGLTGWVILNESVARNETLGNVSFNPYLFRANWSAAVASNSSVVNETKIVSLSFMGCGSISSDTVLANSVYATGDCFSIIADNVTFDCNGSGLFGNGSGNGFLVRNVLNITIANCYITNFTTAVNFSRVNSSLVFNNTLYRNVGYGIYSNFGWNDSLSRNTIINISSGSTFAGGNGIYLNNSNGNNITGNSVNETLFAGIQIESSNSTIIFNNTVFNGARLWYLVSLLPPVTSTIVANNTIYGISSCGIFGGGSDSSGVIANNTIYDLGYYGVGIEIFNVFNITGNHIFNCSWSGIAGGVYNSIVSDNLIHDTRDGIGFESAYDFQNSTIANNTVANNSRNGIVLSVFSKNNALFNNTVYNNSYGVKLIENSSNNSLYLNNISRNSYGVFFSNSSKNLVADSYLSNDAYDFWLELSSGNNTALNTTFNRSLPVVVTDAGSNLTIQWYIRANVTNKGLPVQSSLVNGTSVMGNFTSLGLTDGSGLTGWAILNETIARNELLGNVSFNPYTFRANRSSYVTPKSDSANATKTVDILFGGCGDVGSNLSLSDDIVADGTCLNVTVDNVTIDCEGHILTGNGSGSGVAVFSRSNVTVKNCILINFSYGIEVSSSNNSFFLNNSALDSRQYGFTLVQVNRSVLDRNTADNADEGFRLYYVYNSILANNSASNTIHGFNLALSSGNNLTLNNASSNSAYGFIVSSSTENRLQGNHGENNTISFYLTSSDNNTFENNSASRGNNGFVFAGSNNTFNGDSASGQISHGFAMGGSSNTITNCTSHNNSNGILISSAFGNNVSQCSIYNNSRGIYFYSGSENLVQDSSLYWNTYDFRLESSSANNTALNTTFNRSRPVIVLDADSNLTIQWYIRANVTNNSLSVQSSLVNATDAFANVTSLGLTGASGLTGWVILNETIARSASNVSFNPYVFRANDSGSVTFRSESANETKTILLDFGTNCGQVGADLNLTADVNATGDCYSITADNVTLDCSNSVITGNGSGTGIAASNRVNVTVRNCRITNFSRGINLTSVNNSLAFNNTIYNITTENSRSYGIYFYGGFYDTLSGNLIENISYGTSSPTAVAGISISDSLRSGYLTIANNTVLRVGALTSSASGYGFYIEANNTLVFNNTASNASAHGFYLSGYYLTAINNTVSYALESGIAGWSQNSTIANNTAYSNGENGFALSPIRNDNVTGNTAFSNPRAAGFRIQPLGSQNRISDNVAYNNSNAPGFYYVGGFFFEIAANTSFFNNTAYGNNFSGITFRGASSSAFNSFQAYNNSAYGNQEHGFSVILSGGNLSFSNNTAHGNLDSGFYIATGDNTLFNSTAYNNSYGVRLLGSANNTLGLSTVYDNSYGVFFTSAPRNRVIDSLLYNNPYDFRLESSSANNTALNTTFNRSLPVVVMDTASNLTIQWYVRANVTSAGSPVSGSLVNSTSAMGNFTSLGLSGVDGLTGWAILNETIARNELLGNVSFNPYYFQGNNSIFVLFASDSANETKTVQLSSECGYVDNDTLLSADVSSLGSCFVITTDNITFDCSAHVIVGNGSGYAFMASNRSNITIKNCRITNFTAAINFLQVNASLVLNNTIYSCGMGVNWSGCWNSSISENIIENLSSTGFHAHGVYLASGASNNVTHNRISVTQSGISSLANDTYIFNNSVSSANGGDGISCIGSGCITANNTVHDAGSACIISSDAGLTVNNTAYNCGIFGIRAIAFGNISNNVVYNSTEAGILSESDNSINISNNTVYDSGSGSYYESAVFILQGSNISLSDNIITDNPKNGVTLGNPGGTLVEGVSVSGNQILRNGQSGIYVSSRFLSGTFQNNTLENNTRGAYIEGNGTVFLENTLYNNTQTGFFLIQSVNNSFVRNRISNSTTGINCMHCSQLFAFNNSLSGNPTGFNFYSSGALPGYNIISGNNITNGNSSIVLGYFNSGSYNEISGNFICNHLTSGIYVNSPSLYDSSVISSNNICNSSTGIFFMSGDNQSAFNNSITDSATGIFVGLNSRHNLISGNNITGSTVGIDTSSLWTDFSNNTVCGSVAGIKAIGSYQNFSGTLLCNNTLSLNVSGTDNAFFNTTISNSSGGVSLSDAENASFNLTLISVSGTGVYSSNSSNATFSGTLVNSSSNNFIQFASSQQPLANFSNLTLARNNGWVRFSYLQLNESAISSTARIDSGMASIDSAAVPQYNVSANASLVSSNCTTNISFKSGFPVSAADIIANGSVCSSPRCVITSCGAGRMGFTVASFTGYAPGQNATSPPEPPPIINPPPTPTTPSLLITGSSFCIGQQTVLRIWSEGDPVSGASVSVYSGALYIASGLSEAGAFAFTGSAVGSYSATAAKDEYETGFYPFSLSNCSAEPPPGCSSDFDCPAGYCVNGSCWNCVNNSQCPSGLCINGNCSPCTLNSQCPTNYCVNGSCELCTNSSQCPPGFICANGTCALPPQCAASGFACVSSGDCCGSLSCVDGSCSSCRSSGAYCSQAADCCSGVCADGRCVNCITQQDCLFGYCNAAAGKCVCKLNDASCLRELGIQALESGNVTMPPSQPPVNITPPEPCEIGAFCASDSDCCGGVCLGSRCACKIRDCRATKECCSGYCLQGECLSVGKGLSIASAFENILAPGSGCKGLVSVCNFGGCLELCFGIWLLLAAVSLLAGFISRKEMPLVPVLLALAPFLIGVFTFPFVGIMVGLVEVFFFSYYRASIRQKQAG